MPSTMGKSTVRIEPLRLAVSACLMGQKVRYDGRHKKALELTKWPVEWHLICPEVTIGMGVPRPPIEQRYLRDELKVVEVGDWKKQYQQRLASFASVVAEDIIRRGISGYVLMQKSPSCALQSSAHYEGSTLIRTHAQGYFVAALQQHLPQLPMAEEIALRSPQAQRDFLQQARAYAALNAAYSP